MTTPADILKIVRDKNIEIVDFKFIDLPGNWQHMSAPAHLLTEDVFEEGVTFDGSSIRGFQTIDKSDMLMVPNAETFFIDPFTSVPTLSLTCNVAHPTKERYTFDPRYVALQAEKFLRSSGIADTAYFGPEAEFYIFDAVSYVSSDSIQYSRVDSGQAHWKSAGSDDKPNLGHLMNLKGGYLAVPPYDTYQDLRTEMMQTLESLGIAVEAHHHEVGAAGQAEIRIRFGTLVDTADRLLLYKYVTKNVAYKRGKTVTFMPKPILGDNGSGLHTHQSLWKDGKPLFYDANGDYADLSQLGHFYIGGIMSHAKALLAIAAASTNSYKRLVPGFEAPVNLAFSERNRSSAVRIPSTNNPKAKRIEYRPPDSTANPYLLFSALLMAGLDGIRNGMNPDGYGPYDENLYSDDLPAKYRDRISDLPRSLEEALSELDKDREFLLQGDVFTDDLIDRYIELKRREADQVRICPTPIEYSLYYGV
jgi:glutamine synthetase